MTTATRPVGAHRSDAEVRAARVGMLAGVFVKAPTALILVAHWMFLRSWRRILPLYWALAELVTACVGVVFKVSWATVALLVLAAIAVAGGWPARSRPVRFYRATIAMVLGVFAIATVAAGRHALGTHPTMTVFSPTLAAVMLGWPWWYQLRQHVTIEQPEPVIEMPVDDTLTTKWAARWQHDVIAQGLCAGTRLIEASNPRDGVTDAVVRLAPGAKPKQITRSGTDVEVALDLNVGAVGWRATGRAALLHLTIVEKSYITGGVAWTGPTYTRGRMELTTFTDGTPGFWTASRPGFGALNGLVVGSTGSGKTRALAVLVVNLLHGGWMVVIGDCQGGQSLPDFKNAASEYHAGGEAVERLLYRLHAEVLRRSELLAAAGVTAFDVNDPRVQALGMLPLAAIIDECQLVLIATNTKLRKIVEDDTATSRKTGVSYILGTQLPQMASLAGSVKIRDALAAGNILALRFSNRGSGSTILPDSFVGDPFEIEAEIDGEITAGMGYLRNATQIGMLSRVASMNEATEAARCPRVKMRWLVDPVDPVDPAAVAVAATGTSTGGVVDRIRSAFGVTKPPAVAAAPPAPAALSTPEWVLACLRKAPMSAQALLDRPDCPVNQAQLYAVLTNLRDSGRVIAPAKGGQPYALPN